MLDLTIIRDDPDRVRSAIRDKGTGDPSVVDELTRADAEHRAHLTALQARQAESNALGKEIGALMRDGNRDEAAPLIAENSTAKEAIRELEEAVRAAESHVERLLLEIPNIPHPSVPVGADESGNEVVFEQEGTSPEDAMPHWDVAERFGLVDFDRGARVTGAGFPFYVGRGARLQRALINFFLDLAVEAGYTELEPPFVVNADSARGTGQLPDKEDLMYESERDGLYLIPTGELPVTNYHRGEILEADRLPLRYCAYTPCWRREAGSYGKEVRGLNRLHQFDKVELVRFERPEHSYEALEALREDAERPLRRLELPYRRLLMCTGDMGFTQAKKYDLEVWSAGQGRWLEVSSVSNFESFQARRMQIRTRTGGGTEFVHTLNGSGLALPRIVAALLENGQEAGGGVVIPDALRPYTGFDRID